MKIEVCIGSSCHLRGSAQVIELLRAALAAHNLTDRVSLSGAFCLGQCSSSGVSVRVDDVVFSGVSEENFEPFFTENVLANC